MNMERKAPRHLFKVLLISWSNVDGYDIATKAFGPILERRQKAEKIRSQLAMLERFRFFFNLPNSLRTSIAQQNYEQAVRDFKKATSFLQSNPSETFNRIYKNIEAIIVELCKTLEDRMKDPLLEHSEQERIISYLIDLKAKSNPIKLYLKIQEEYICSILRKVHEEYCINEQSKNIFIF
jgi:exocyst complex component 2